MAPRRNQTYQYRSEDDPVTVASQFGITPGQLLAANPGGSPFVTGQNINIPFQYNTPSIYSAPAPVVQYGGPIGPQPAPAQAAPPFGVVPGNVGAPGFPGANLGRVPDNVGAGGLQPAPTGYGTDDSWYRTPAQAAAANQAYRNLQAGAAATPGGNRPASAPLLEGDFYGYERDPESGRSVRVVKNAATSNFLNELRWDPERRKYVSIGRLLKQGKLDLKGNWNKRGRRKRNPGAASDLQVQVEINQDYTLTNSFISFNASAG